jgi:hypothetical protein
MNIYGKPPLSPNAGHSAKMQAQGTGGYLHGVSPSGSVPGGYIGAGAQAGPPARAPTTIELVIDAIRNHLFELSSRRFSVYSETEFTADEKAHILRLAWECRHILPPELAVYVAVAGGIDGEKTE